MKIRKLEHEMAPGLDEHSSFDVFYSEDEIPKWLPSLTPAEEIQRQNRKDPLARNQFKVSRSLVRRLMADFLQKKYSDIEFTTTELGKPILANKELAGAVDFSISHSGELLVVGVDFEGFIGVDIQKQRPPVMKTAERVFTTTEILWAQAGSTEVFEKRFFRLWSAKEAIIKANAGGVFRHAKETELREVDGKLVIRKLPEGFGPPDSWTLEESDMIPKHSLAVARKRR